VDEYTDTALLIDALRPTEQSSTVD
jgi:hypothetical protein